MSALLEEILADLRAKRLDYADYLKRIAELAGQVQRGHTDAMPEVLKQNRALRAVYNNLASDGGVTQPAIQGAHEGRGSYEPAGDPRLALAQRIDETVRRVRPDDWRGHQARENVIKRALLPLLHSPEEVERLFVIIKQQAEY